MKLFIFSKLDQLTNLVSLLAIASNNLSNTTTVIRRRRRTYWAGSDGV